MSNNSSAELARILLSILCLLILFLLPFSMNQTTAEEEAAVSALAPETLRFHILANSDSDTDQAVKLEVRDLLLQKMQAEMKTGQRPVKQDFLTYIRKHANELEQTAEAFLTSRGLPYPVRIETGSFRFPAREAAGKIFPAGTYDAIRVLLGDARGHNWWCVLYPPLAFSSSQAVSSDCTSQQGAVSSTSEVTIEIRFKLLDWIRGPQTQNGL